ncbi:MAG: acetyltransferase [Clostridiales Family XIII bacterium]|jgi:sugar O-acyltransferase (sialic acid O-acetyltransferase NeuD family)|nr:acetyltransferase [Clostridiales Family XIII bacterium]
MKELYIIGAGGLGRETADTVCAINERTPEYKIVGFLDDAETLRGSVINDIPVLGGRAYLKENTDASKPCAVIAVADPRAKETIADDLNAFVIWENIVHPTAVVSRYAEIGCGAIIQSHTILSSNTKIGNHVIINVSSVLGHDAVLEDFVSVMSLCDITGGVHIGKGAYLTSSVAVIPNVRIGEYAYIGAGSTVIKDVNANAIMVGNPARQIR